MALDRFSLWYLADFYYGTWLFPLHRSLNDFKVPGDNKPVKQGAPAVIAVGAPCVMASDESDFISFRREYNGR